MKAKVLLTGEIIDVRFSGKKENSVTNVYMEIGTGRIFPDYELEFLTEELPDEEKHWQDVRERAAIAAMQSILTSDTFRQAKVKDAMNVYESPYKEIAATAIKFADELVIQLKEE